MFKGFYYNHLRDNKASSVYKCRDNICETYNKKMNSSISKPHPNIFKLIDLLKEHEQLASISFEKANLGQVKSRRTKEDLKDKEIFFMCSLIIIE
jgi:hypothetical protein